VATHQRQFPGLLGIKRRAVLHSAQPFSKTNLQTRIPGATVNIHRVLIPSQVISAKLYYRLSGKFKEGFTRSE
jgi:hypothetical protein